MKRVAQVVNVKPEQYAAYKSLHAQVWEDVLERIKKANIRNYSIHYRDDMLFSYFEYIGTDYAKDMEDMAADAKTQEWWAVCKPCLFPVQSEKVSDCWADMEEIFFFEG